MEIVRNGLLQYLTGLDARVRVEGSAGFFDIHKASEPVIRNLMNIFYGWQLKVENGVNAAGFDLCDRENRVFVQVTSNCTDQKVKDCLRTTGERVAKAPELKNFRLYMVFLTTDGKAIGRLRKKTAAKLDAGDLKAEGFRFDPAANILQLDDFVQFLRDDCGPDGEDITPEQLQKIQKLLDKYAASLGQSRPTLNLPLPGALEKGHFVGREAELAALAEKLKDPGSRQIFVTGLGGMGKTALVKRFCADYTGGRVYFALFQDNFKDTVALRMAQGLPGDPNRQPDPERDYHAVLELLRSCGPEDILVIDNADEPEGNFGKLAADPAWGELTKLPLRLIITTRCSVDRAVEAGAMAKESLRKIFDNHDVPLQDPEKDALIGAVRGHTMTVDLMARTLKHNRSLSVEKLLEAMGSGILPEQKYRPVEVDRDGDSSQAQIYVHLKNLFHVAELSENDRKLLRWAVLLPEGGMKLEYLQRALPEDMELLPDAQIDRCWLSHDRETGLVTLHPVLRLVCREELRPDDENCGEFLHAVGDQFSRTQYDAVKYRQFAELFSRAAEQLPDTQADWAIRAGVLWNQVGMAANARRYEEQAVRRLEETMPDSLKLATAHNNLGYTYGDLGDQHKALEYKLKALEIFEKVLPGDHPALATSYNNVGLTYGALGDHNKALKCKRKALEICEKVLPGEHPNLATSYNNVGYTYGDLGDHDKALEYKLKALAIWEKALPENHPDLALSYINVGGTYGALGDHRKAQEYKLKALEICEKVLPGEHPNLATSYNNVGSAYHDLGDYNKALEYKLKALAIREKVLPGEHPDLATSYNNVGSTYHDLGDYNKALEYKLKALAIWEKALPGDHPDLAASYNNVGNTYGALGNHNKALEYALKALAIREEVLPKDHPDLALSYHNVGATYFALGDLPRAVSCLEKAVGIARRALPEGHPDRERYQEDLAYVQSLMQQK